MEPLLREIVGNRDADYPGDMNAITPCIAVAIVSVLSLTPSITPLAEAAPPVGGGAPGVQINAQLVCEIEAYQWDYGTVPFTKIDLEDEDSISSDRILYIDMKVTNYGPSDADDLASSFLIWGRRIALFDVDNTIDLADGNTWVESTSFSPEDLENHRRLNIIIETGLDNRFGGGLFEYCS